MTVLYNNRWLHAREFEYNFFFHFFHIWDGRPEFSFSKLSIPAFLPSSLSQYSFLLRVFLYNTSSVWTVLVCLNFRRPLTSVFCALIAASLCVFALHARPNHLCPTSLGFLHVASPDFACICYQARMLSTFNDRIICHIDQVRPLADNRPGKSYAQPI